MTSVDWTAPALADLRLVDAWLTQHASPEQAHRTLEEIGRRATFLADFPRGGRPMLEHDFRILRVTQTPYLIIYRLAAKAGVQILRIRHEREDWQVET